MNPNPEREHRYAVCDRGADGETRATEWLEARGIRILFRNHVCRMGEIDIVARDDDTLVIIEVRLRSLRDPVGSAASVSDSKQRRIIAATRHLLMRNPQLNDLPIRFDVIAIDGERLCWLRDAFRVD